MSEAKQRRFSVSSLLIIIVSVALFAMLLVNRQFIVDYARSIQYNPSSTMAAIRGDLKLTDKGTFYFNASQPALEPAAQFNQNCRQTAETNNPILGCYDTQRIYVFEVTNQKLDGIEQTTAAHELLHAVYERMSDSEKRTVDAELEKAYQAHKTADLEARMEYYQKSEPGEEMNELHSILGTEVADLGSDLEAHYRQYFTDRQAVVGYHEEYAGVFTSVTNQLKALSDDINTQTDALNQRIDAYNQAAKQLQADADDFKKRNQEGSITSLSQFNSEQNTLLDRQAALNTERQAISDLVAGLNAKRDEYNQLVDEYNQLNVSINSKLTPVNSFN